MSAPIRIVLADDHAPTRAGVRTALEAGGFSIVAEASNAAEAVDGALRERPEVCLLDVFMPGEGIEAAREIKAALPRTRIVMLTVSTDDADLFEALRAGAEGYLLKTIAPDRLPHALHGVLKGEAALPRSLAARLIDEFRSRPRRRRLTRLDGAGAEVGVELTDREHEVLELMLEELSTVEIAQRLSIADVTVRRHVSAIVKKAGASDRRGAMDALRTFERNSR
jgi:DNA-binding NarL/FixJ family response regulator